MDGAPQSLWPAASGWAALADARDAVCDTGVGGGALSKVCVQRNSGAGGTFFYYTLQAPLLRAANMTLVEPYSVEDVPCHQFFDVASGGTSSSDDFGATMYFSRPFEQLAGGAALADACCRPHEQLAHGGGRLNLWLGSANATARLHYDASANLFTQITGRKRFLLAPPRVAHRLYPFSKVHPGHRQAQLDPAATNVSAFPLFRRRLLQEVVVHPGDTLYIPPFYWHQVTSLDASVSVNVYRPAGETRTAQRVLSKRPKLPPTLPGHPDVTFAANAAVLRDFLLPAVRTVHEELFADYEALHKAQSDAEQADGASSPGVKPLMPVARSVAAFAKLLAQSRWSHQAQDVLVKRRGQPQTAVLCDGSNAKPSGVNNDDVAAEVAALIRLLPPDLREQVLGDYVEEVVAAVLGPLHVQPFLVQCFSTRHVAPQPLQQPEQP